MELTLSLLMMKFVICLCPLQTVLDPDQDRQNVGPDLDPYCFDALIVFLIEIFKKLI